MLLNHELEPLEGELMSITDHADDRVEPEKITDAAKELAEVRVALEHINSARASLNKRFDWLRQEVLPKMMEDAGITQVTVEGAGRIHLQDDAWVRIPAASKERAFDWFNDHGFGDLITYTMNAQTLKAFVMRRMKAGEEIPESVVVTPYQRAVLTREK